MDYGINFLNENNLDKKLRIINNYMSPELRIYLDK